MSPAGTGAARRPVSKGTPFLVVLLGATGTGKSALAVRLAERFGGEVVNGDSRQIYRGLDVGTAKPPAALRARVPHHLYDIAGPAEDFSAGEFMRRADAALADIRARGRLPVVAGGTGFYLRSLLEGLFDEGGSSAEVKERLRGILAKRRLPQLRRLLERLDGATAARLAPGDTQRTLRALEVYFATGRPLSEHLAEHARKGGPRYASLKIGLRLPREAMKAHLDARVDAMLAAGWVEEVKRLLARGCAPECRAFEALGYREMAAWLRGGGDFALVAENIRRAHRRYAKRQETWFRKESSVRWLDARDPALEEKAAALVGERLRGPGEAA